MRPCTSTGSDTTHVQSTTMPASKGVDLSGDASSADLVPRHLQSSTTQSVQPAKAYVTAEPSEEPALAASDEPVSADKTSQSSAAEPQLPLSDGASCFLQSHELEVAAALLMVMEKAQKDGREAAGLMKEILFTNNPITCIVTELMPDSGKLPSPKQLARSASENLQKALYLLSEQCAATGCGPLEVFTRSAECTTHCAALHSTDSAEKAARLQRLQAIEVSLAISSAAESREGELHRKLSRRADLLSQHGASRETCDLMAATLHDTVLLLDADQMEEEKDPLMAGAISSFTTCIDHMLPGVLDGLLQHDGDDLTSVPALLKMLPPLEKALESYRARAAAAKGSPAHTVRVEATVQGWPARAPHDTKLLDAMIAYLQPHAAVLDTQLSDTAGSTASDSTARCDHGDTMGKGSITAAAGVLQAAQPQRGMRQQGDQVLAEPDADVDQGNEELAYQGQSMPAVEEAEDAAEQQMGLSEAENTEGRRAGQRAAWAQTAAQVAETQEENSKELGLAEGIGSTCEQDKPAESNIADEPPEALQLSNAAASPASEGLPALTVSAPPSDVAGSSRSSSLSPQPSLAFPGSLHSGPPPASEDLEAKFEKMWDVATSSRAAQAAPAAQAWTFADDQEEEEPWQEVSRPQRKPAKQQAISEPAAHKGRRQGGAKPIQATPAKSPSRLRRAQATSQHVAQALPKTLPAPRASGHYSRVAASSRASSLSPQHSMQMQEGRSRGQQVQHMPRRAARAAQPPAQEKQHWQEKNGRRRPVSKKAASEPRTRRASQLHSEVTVSSRSSSLSPQSSVHQHGSTSDGQQAFDLASWPALGAQASTQAAQAEQPLQDASASYCKPISQQAASESYASTARKQGRGTPDQTTPAQSPPRQRKVQASAQHAEQAIVVPQGSKVPLNAQPIELLLHRLSVMTKNMPQQPSQQECLQSKPPLGPEASTSSMQSEPAQKIAGVDAVDQEFAALQQMLRPRPCSEPSSRAQATSIADLSDEHEPHEDELCIVCLEKLREVITFPCGHMCTCQGCARDVMACPIALCPVCRAHIQTTITAKF